MSFSLRIAQPCSRCQDGVRLCQLVREELQATIRRLNDLEAFAQAKAPDAELVVECHSFRPKTRPRKGA